MKLSKLFDRTLLKFLLVGCANTLCAMCIMYLLYNLAHLGYWGSSAVAFTLASMLSFFLNRSFTFRSTERLWKTAVRFAVNIAVCYLLAYSAAQPLAEWALSRFLARDVVEQIAMLLGMCIFTGLNYLGQRFFAFRRPKVHS